MQIIEQTVVAKSPKKKSEDGIVVTNDFVAVIDGSTSKSSSRLSRRMSNGRYAMTLVASYIRHMAADTSCHQFCKGVTAFVFNHYKTPLLPFLTPSSRLRQLEDHPEQRMAASAVVFSRVRREVWMVGDCQCLIGGEYYDNPKPYEQELAEQRAAIILAGDKPQEDYLTHDTARDQIIPRMVETMKRQNKDYAVIDGFKIPEDKVLTLSLDFSPWEIVLATDGYPFLMPTLAESEERLAHQKAHDPLNVRHFKATKAFMAGNNSFDDRAYIRFKV